ncbi:MAG: tRNA (guanosine(46)-N7)-methyltransferase TrmB [Proteobacteria bacterium]|nr:tRNA (guanosine(46)-N7)-methyltransferase TrmB [Pseudomonadota bacterium]
MTGKPQDKTLRWYGRRRGHKLRPGRRALMNTLLPRLRLELPPAGATLDLASAFDFSVSEVWLEVGFGAGEHLAAQAGAHPDIGFIGCEPFINGIAGLLSRIESEGLTNVRVFDDDARKFLPYLPEASIGRIYALFTDPWPKKRHHRRRFISDQTVGELARALADGGELRLASDHEGYVEWMLERVARHPDFSWPAPGRRDWTDPPADWVETRYERKAKKQGLKPVYLRFPRRPRNA